MIFSHNSKWITFFSRMWKFYSSRFSFFVIVWALWELELGEPSVLFLGQTYTRKAMVDRGQYLGVSEGTWQCCSNLVFPLGWGHAGGAYSCSYSRAECHWPSANAHSTDRHPDSACVYMAALYIDWVECVYPCWKGPLKSAQFRLICASIATVFLCGADSPSKSCWLIYSSLKVWLGN